MPTILTVCVGCSDAVDSQPIDVNDQVETETVEVERDTDKNEGAEGPLADGANEITAAEALQIAEEAYLKRGVRWEYEKRVRRTERGFDVHFVSLPKAPGGHTTFLVSTEGEILRVLGGA